MYGDRPNMVQLCPYPAAVFVEPGPMQDVEDLKVIVSSALYDDSQGAGGPDCWFMV